MWFKVDDGFHSHTKLAGVSFSARGLWVTAGSWCGDQLTDGAVPAKMLKAWGASPKWARELVEAGLWEVTPEGFQFHDWTDLNPTRDEVLEKRTDTTRRQREFRERNAGVTRYVTRDKRVSHSGITSESHRNPALVTRDSSVSHASPDPIRSDPTRSDQEKRGGDADSERARGALGIIDSLARAWNGTGMDVLGGKDKARLERVLPWLEQLATAAGKAPVAVWTEAVTRFKGDAELKRKSMCTLAVLCAQLDQWTSGGPRGGGGGGAPSSLEAFERQRATDVSGGAEPAF